MRTRQLKVGCEFVYRAAIATPAVLQVQARDLEGVSVIRHEWATEPNLHIRQYTDVYGNSCVRLVLPAGASTLRYDALALVPDATEPVDEDAPELSPEELPDDVLLYTLPSRYCLPDMLGDEAWSRFGPMTTGYSRVREICGYVNEHLTFQYGSSSPQSTAVDVNLSGYGVCRDFTHLAITFCRALNIPARYVFGYLPDIDVPPPADPMDFCAWMQVWLGDRWWTFDPRNNRARKGRVVIGWGRDAADVAMVTSYGGARLDRMEVWADQVDDEAAL
jgi:transglutaminase-like putative cysteine protease